MRFRPPARALAPALLFEKGPFAGDGWANLQRAATDEIGKK